MSISSPLKLNLFQAFLIWWYSPFKITKKILKETKEDIDFLEDQLNFWGHILFFSPLTTLSPGRVITGIIHWKMICCLYY